MRCHTLPSGQEPALAPARKGRGAECARRLAHQGVLGYLPVSASYGCLGNGVIRQASTHLIPTSRQVTSGTLGKEDLEACQDEAGNAEMSRCCMDSSVVHPGMHRCKCSAPVQHRPEAFPCLPYP